MTSPNSGDEPEPPTPDEESELDDKRPLRLIAMAFLAAATPVLFQLFVRFVLWLMGMYAAAWPALKASNVVKFGWISDLAIGALKADHYSEFYFVTVVAAIVGFTTSMIQIIAQFTKFSEYVKGKTDKEPALWPGPVFILFAIIFGWAIFVTESRFDDLLARPIHGADLEAVQFDIGTLSLVLAVGLAAELLAVVRERWP